MTRSDAEVKLALAKSRHAKNRMALLLKIRSRKYPVGTHGSAKSARKALGTTGAAHESEHPIGFNVYAEGIDRKRGEGAKIEKGGLAYLEVESRHAAHPGTGSGHAADAYRTVQRGILDDGASGNTDKTVSSAIQYNQLEYAHLGSTIEDGPDEQAIEIVDVSYEAMIRNGASVTYYQNGRQVSFQISQVERAELLLAYAVRKTGRWPTPDEIKQALRSVGLEPLIAVRNGKQVVT